MPSATARDFQRAASRLGFVRRRQTGSHERWNKILRQLGVSVEEFERLR